MQSTPAFASKECLAIGGTKTESHKQNPKAFQQYVENLTTDQKKKETLKLGNINCKVFDGWKELDRYLFNILGQAKHTKENKYLIVQYGLSAYLF